MVDWQTFGNTPFQTANVGFRDFAIALDREDQSDVDIDALGGELLNRAEALLGSGNLDQHILAVERTVQPARINRGRLGIEGQLRRHFDTDEAVAAVGRLINRKEEIGRRGNVFEDQRFVDFPCGLAFLG